MNRSVDLTPALLATGWLLADSLARWQEWSHRKVDAVDLLEGSRGRRRVSIDFSSPRVMWQPGESPSDLIELVPLTVLTKAPLRSFDLRDDSGRSLSVLPTDTNGLLGAAAIAALIAGELGEDVAHKYWAQIVEVTTAPGQEAESLAGDLIMQLNAQVFTTALIRDLARNFLLIAALQPSEGPARRVIKFSYHWDTRSSSQPRIKRIRAGFGIASADLVLEMNALDSSKSFHLECVAPTGLRPTELTLPIDADRTLPTDKSGSAVAHAHGRYGWEEAKNPGDARIKFVVDPGALLVRIMWSSLAVAALFVALLLAPDSLGTLRDSTDAAITLLVFLPAFLIVLGTRGAENRLVTEVLWPLRAWAFVLTFLLVLTGSFLVLKAPWWLVTSAWWFSAIASGLVFLVLLSSWLRLRVTPWA
jgi:hypothetical protein